MATKIKNPKKKAMTKKPVKSKKAPGAKRKSKVSPKRVTKKILNSKPYKKATTVISQVEALYRANPLITAIQIIAKIKAKNPRSKIKAGTVAYYSSIMRNAPYNIDIPKKPTCKDGILPKKSSKAKPKAKAKAKAKATPKKKATKKTQVKKPAASKAKKRIKIKRPKK